MAKITYQGRTFTNRNDESVLDTLIRQATDVKFSCRNGICQVCLTRCLEGNVPEDARHNLKPDLQDKGYFLPCKCHPDSDLVLAPPLDDDLFSPTSVAEKKMLSADICQILLEPVTGLNIRPGQFINLKRHDGLVRSYSLANRPESDYFLEFHVKRMPGGQMSNWVLDDLNPGDELEIQGPQGNCFYQARHDQDMLMIATGTGLAPLLGVIREALSQNHKGKISLYHGSRHLDGLYLQDELKQLAAQHDNFTYQPCLSSDEVKEGYVHGRAHEVAFSQHEILNGVRVYLAGMPKMIEAATLLARNNGAIATDILADPFELMDKRKQERAEADPHPQEVNSDRRAIPPDPDTWKALGEGELLNKVLNDFYPQIYKDERLAPFFQHATVERSIEKQFSFIKSTLLGDKSYFGDRPRNAHHWMVISDDLFDYREDLFEKVMLKHGASAETAGKLRALNEMFRSDIVKDKPWQRYLDGIPLPLDGFAEETLSEGALCDGCERVLDPGENVKYHLRMGKIYCNQCTESESFDKAM